MFLTGVVDPDQGHLTDLTIALCSVFPGNPIGNTSCENVYEEGITYFGEQVLITLYHSSYWSADQHSTDINVSNL